METVPYNLDLQPDVDGPGTSSTTPAVEIPHSDVGKDVGTTTEVAVPSDRPAVLDEVTPITSKEQRKNLPKRRKSKKTQEELEVPNEAADEPAPKRKRTSKKKSEEITKSPGKTRKSKQNKSNDAEEGKEKKTKSVKAEKPKAKGKAKAKAKQTSKTTEAKSPKKSKKPASSGSKEASGSDAKSEAKKKASRKSSAYHCAMNAALREGKSPEEAKAAAKKVP